jgi:tetrapyrrole methylase family protein / MazG family protein
MEDAETAGKEFAELVRILDRLRGIHGCPWDRKQTARSIVNYFLEEVYEAVDAVISHSPEELREELGDVLMEIVFLARIYKEKDVLTMTEVVKGINRKMIRRHPHVFGRKEKISSPDKVKDEWNRRKQKDKSRRSVLDGLPLHTPALLEAFQIGLRAAAYGFDWENLDGVWEKVKEEIREVEEGLETWDREKTAEEIGDLFFALANLARHLAINPEIALKAANRKFIERFQFIEQKLLEQNKNIEDASFEEMEKLWNQCKQAQD